MNTHEIWKAPRYVLKRRLEEVENNYSIANVHEAAEIRRELARRDGCCA